MNSVAGNVTVDKKRSVSGSHPKGLSTVGEEGEKNSFFLRHTKITLLPSIQTIFACSRAS
jgi:hypothetical protein